jgi:hypothetical protein
MAERRIRAMTIPYTVLPAAEPVPDATAGLE